MFQGKISTTGGGDVEQNKNVGPVSTVMKFLTTTDADFLSHFDKIDETQDEIGKTSIKHLLFNNYDIAVNEGKIEGKLPLEHIFGFCRTLKKILNN